MNKKTIQFVIEEITLNYKKSKTEATQIVFNSFFPKVLKEIPDYVQHYTADYWATQIISDYTKGDNKI